MPNDEQAPGPQAAAGAQPRAAMRAVWSLRGYLWRLILLPMVPLVLLALLLAGDSLRRQHEADARNATLLAEHLAAQVDRLLARHVLALQMLADSPVLDAPGTTGFHRQAQVARSHLLGDVVLADAQGHMLAHSGRPAAEALPPMPLPGGQAAAPQALASGQPTVGNRYIGPLSSRPMVAVAVPVQRPG